MSLVSHVGSRWGYVYEHWVTVDQVEERYQNQILKCSTFSVLTRWQLYSVTESLSYRYHTVAVSMEHRLLYVTHRLNIERYSQNVP